MNSCPKNETNRHREILSQWVKQTCCESIVNVEDGDDFGSLSIHANRSDLGRLAVGLSEPHFRCAKEIIERVFWVNGPAQSILNSCRRSTAVVSSRLGQKLEERQILFDALRTLCCRMQPTKNFLISHSSMTMHDHVKRSAELFGIGMIEFRPMPEEIDIDWFQQIAADGFSEAVVFYDRRRFDDAVGVDHLMVAIAYEVRVLFVNQRGNTMNAISRRVECGDENRSVFVLNQGGKLKPHVQTLMDAGATGWYLYTNEENDIQAVQATNKGDANVALLNDFSRTHALDEYLLHWTRRCVGPWPNQPVAQFYDDLIFARIGSKHDRLATLLKILADKTILASNVVTRDSTPVVSFSEVTVDKLADFRTFRSHLSRWDFETVGVAVKKSLLQQRGAMQVVYGDDDCWNNMDDDQKPFFQNTGDRIDWSVEMEWRLIGNLHLQTIAKDDAFVFVDNFQDALTVSPFTNFKVIVL